MKLRALLPSDTTRSDLLTVKFAELKSVMFTGIINWSVILKLIGPSAVIFEPFLIVIFLEIVSL